MNELYPIFLKIKNKPVLVIGGGGVAGRRTQRLVECDARVTVVSPEVVPEIAELSALGKLTWQARTFEASDVRDVFLVFLAVGDAALAKELEKLSVAHGFLLNTAADQTSSDFHVPATIDLSPLKIAVSTGGLSPRAAMRIRDALSAWVRGHEESVREIIASGRDRASSAGDQSGAQPGWVYLIGGGPGNPELLTRRAHALLQSADLIYYDRLISDEILQSLPTATEKVYVGKEVGCAHRANIADLMIEAARSGRAVVRLKGGDPMIYGRGGEEMLALREAAMPFEVVPGVSALSAVPAAAHIPVTYRGIASEIVVRSGHRLPLTQFEADDGRTEKTYVYFMAVSRLDRVVKELSSEGVASSTPAAIVENGTTANQRVIQTTLAELANVALEQSVTAPALVIVGNVVLFRNLEQFLPLIERHENSEVGGAW